MQAVPTGIHEQTISQVVSVSPPYQQQQQQEFNYPQQQQMGGQMPQQVMLALFSIGSCRYLLLSYIIVTLG